MEARMKFFTGDNHYNHKGMIEFGLRPYKNTWAMNAHMIELWNKIVPPGGLVYHLGDFFMPNKGDGDDPAKILDRLNGQIIWILGNHDHKNSSLVLRDHKKIAKVCDVEYIRLDGDKQKVMLCHYPMLTWRASMHGSWMLHGHCHGNLPPMDGLRMDVGVDTNNMCPYSEHDIREKMKNKIISKIDENKT